MTATGQHGALAAKISQGWHECPLAAPVELVVRAEGASPPGRGLRARFGAVTVCDWNALFNWHALSGQGSSR